MPIGGVDLNLLVTLRALLEGATSLTQAPGWV